MKKELYERKRQKKKLELFQDMRNLAESSCEKDFKNGAAEELLVTFHVMKLSKAGAKKKTKENAKAVTLTTSPYSKTPTSPLNPSFEKLKNMLLHTETMTQHTASNHDKKYVKIKKGMSLKKKFIF